ncbi:MAG: P-loop NTPase [Candidatus Hadarchaeales archaeon]
MDPRPLAAERMLSGVKKILCIGSGKGGVGKSLVTSLTALLMKKRGAKVGLLDLDLHGPSLSTILGENRAVVREDRGLLPQRVAGIQLMSILPFVGSNPSFLRGYDVSNAVLELLSVTRWGSLDFLLVDMPPGGGDGIMDIARFIRRAGFLLVSTPSKVTLPTVRTMTLSLLALGMRIEGIVENMSIGEPPLSKELAEELGVRFLGVLPFDAEVEKAIGEPKKLLKTAVAAELEKIIKRLVK